jgi:hypothetical protein
VPNTTLWVRLGRRAPRAPRATQAGDGDHVVARPVDLLRNRIAAEQEHRHAAGQR